MTYETCILKKRGGWGGYGLKILLAGEGGGEGTTLNVMWIDEPTRKKVLPSITSSPTTHTLAILLVLSAACQYMTFRSSGK